MTGTDGFFFESMEIQKRILLETEGHGERVRNLYGLAVVTSGHPLGHCLHYAECFLVECRVAGTHDAYIGD